MSSWPNTQRRTCAAILYALPSHCLQGEVLNSISLFLSFHSFTLDFICIACFIWIQTLRTMLHLSLGVQEDFLFLFLCLVSENVGFFIAIKILFSATVLKVWSTLCPSFFHAESNDMKSVKFDQVVWKLHVKTDYMLKLSKTAIWNLTFFFYVSFSLSHFQFSFPYQW